MAKGMMFFETKFKDDNGDTLHVSARVYKGEVDYLEVTRTRVDGKQLPESNCDFKHLIGGSPEYLLGFNYKLTGVCLTDNAYPSTSPNSWPKHIREKYAPETLPEGIKAMKIIDRNSTGGGIDIYPFEVKHEMHFRINIQWDTKKGAVAQILSATDYDLKLSDLPALQQALAVAEHEMQRLQREHGNTATQEKQS